MSDIDVERLRAAAGIDRVEYQPTLSSTNDRARELAAELQRDVTLLVMADEQTAGRGRGANRWWTGRGSLALSVLLDPTARGIERRYLAMIALATATAIVDTVAPLVPGHTVGLHWPNDVFVGPRKLAGILVEALPDGRHIVGIGLNVNNSVAEAPEPLRAIVTTLADLAEHTFDRTALMIELLSAFNSALEVLAHAPHELGRHSDRLCLQHGQQLALQSGAALHEGRCLGIADDGALVLETERGRETFYSGVLIK